MKNDERLEAVHTPLTIDGLVFRTQKHKVKLRQGRCTNSVRLSCLLLHAREEVKQIYNKIKIKRGVLLKL